MNRIIVKRSIRGVITKTSENVNLVQLKISNRKINAITMQKASSFVCLILNTYNCKLFDGQTPTYITISKVEEF